MVKDIVWITIASAIVIALWMSVVWPNSKTEVVTKYDCRMLIGGWHPDVPAKVIEECRQRSGK